MNSGPGSTVSSVLVGSGAGAYPVLVGEGLLEHLPDLLREYAHAYRYVLIADDRVAELHGTRMLERLAEHGLRSDLLTFPRGEASKTRERWARLTDRMIELGVGRDGAVVALGGGVTGDLAGFVAATYLRGLPVVQVPTSLVAMIDSSVGGKTGVDLPSGKNLVGAFHPPRAVVVDPAAARTLSPHERAQGLVEAVKHGAILDAAYFEVLARSARELMEGGTEATRAAVLRSVQLKARVVSEDEHESGLRQILNFGHTLGHGLEAAAGYGIGHGTAVAAGMILEARLGERIGVTERGAAERLTSALAGFGVGEIPAGLRDPEAVLAFLGADKKARRGRPRYVLLQSVGRVAGPDEWSREVPDAVVRAVVEEAMTGAADATGTTA